MAIVKETVNTKGHLALKYIAINCIWQVTYYKIKLLKYQFLILNSY